ncbi:MAG: type II secretion system protein [Vulcanimicrobiota bacterium]
MGHLHRGFSLLETTLATALLCAVSLFLFNLYPASAMSVRQAQDQLVAESLAQSILEERRSQPFSSLVLGKTALTSVVYAGNSYYPELQVFSPGDDVEALKGLRVTVSWRTPRGPRSQQYELLVANLES